MFWLLPNIHSTQPGLQNLHKEEYKSRSMCMSCSTAELLMRGTQMGLVSARICIMVVYYELMHSKGRTPQLITHSHGHLSWADMLHHERPATSSAVKTCSFNCCISLCMHAHDPQRRGGRVHFVLEVTCMTYPNGKKAVR